MLELSLFVLKLDNLLVKLITVSSHALFLLFQAFELIFILVIGVLKLLGECFVLLLFTSKLFLTLTHSRFILAHLLPYILSEIDVSHSLLHHEVHRIDCVLDVLWLCSEDVSNRWDSVALLSLSYVLKIVHESCNLHLLVVLCIRKKGWSTSSGW